MSRINDVGRVSKEVLTDFGRVIVGIQFDAERDTTFGALRSSH